MVLNGALSLQFCALFIEFHCSIVPAKVSETSNEQSEKAVPSILVTLLGIVIEVSEEQP